MKRKHEPTGPTPLSERIRIARENSRQGLTQEEAARKVGRSTRTYIRWEKGESNPKEYDLRKIATALLVPFEELKALAIPLWHNEGKQFRTTWQHAHERSPTGLVWAKIHPAYEHKNTPHQLTVITLSLYTGKALPHVFQGRHDGVIKFDQMDHKYFVHEKGGADILFVYVSIEPPAYITFGQGDVDDPLQMSTNRWAVDKKGIKLFPQLPDDATKHGD